MLLRKKLSSFKKYIVRLFRPTGRFSLQSAIPFSPDFGYTRGTPIDRFYIESFLRENEIAISGIVLEVGERYYSRIIGTASEAKILAPYSSKEVDLVVDLTQELSVPEGIADCFICVQTLNFIFEFEVAIRSMYKILKPGGTLLLTTACLSPISRFDADRWGDFYRFTPDALERIFRKVLGKVDVKIDYYGNVRSATGFFYGLTIEDVSVADLDFKDPNFPLIVTAVVKKPCY